MLHWFWNCVCVCVCVCVPACCRAPAACLSACWHLRWTSPENVWDWWLSWGSDYSDSCASGRKTEQHTTKHTVRSAYKVLWRRQKHTHRHTHMHLPSRQRSLATWPVGGTPGRLWPRWSWGRWRPHRWSDTLWRWAGRRRSGTGTVPSWRSSRSPPRWFSPAPVASVCQLARL